METMTECENIKQEDKEKNSLFEELESQAESEIKSEYHQKIKDKIKDKKREISMAKQILKNLEIDLKVLMVDMERKFIEE